MPKMRNEKSERTKNGTNLSQAFFPKRPDSPQSATINLNIPTARDDSSSQGKTFERRKRSNSNVCDEDVEFKATKTILKKYSER